MSRGKVWRKIGSIGLPGLLKKLMKSRSEEGRFKREKLKYDFVQ